MRGGRIENGKEEKKGRREEIIEGRKLKRAKGRSTATRRWTVIGGEEE